MLFTSLEFLFLFLPVVLVVYFCLNDRLKNVWLLMASLFFYAWGEPKFVVVMIGSIAFNYLMALLVSCTQKIPAVSRGFMVMAVAGNLSVLFLYKYANFVTSVTRELFPEWQGVIPQTSYVLPIGISFFTFQALSYVIDVRRGVPVQRNPLNLALYIALFPQLIAGPIVRYTTVCEQILHRSVTPDAFAGGVYRFLVGFNKKILLANLFAVTADRAFAATDLTAGFAWLGAVAYSFQILFDFSGYSDMAIGLGAMFGFRFLENFNYPYVSKTITEFWRRWHISLGSWFRDYVYFPLGGSRVGKWRMLANLAVVWLLTGIWHGANWTFILWGVLYGVLISFEKLADLPRHVENSRILRSICQPLTLLAVLAGWVLFRSPSLSSAGMYFKAMLGGGTKIPIAGRDAFEFGEIFVVLVCGILCSTPFPSRVACWLGRRCPAGDLLTTIGGWTCQLALFLASVSFLIMRAHNPFIYFNF